VLGQQPTGLSSICEMAEIQTKNVKFQLQTPLSLTGNNKRQKLKNYIEGALSERIFKKQVPTGFIDL
jgi:hypothetical protein